MKRSSGWRLFALLGTIVLAISVVMVGMEWTRSSVPVVGGPAGTRYVHYWRLPFLIFKQRTLPNGKRSVEIGIGLRSTAARGSQGGGL